MSRVSAQPWLWFPQHWPMWLALGFLWITDKLPWPEKRWLARRLGWLVFNIICIRRRIVFTNLRLCYPTATTAQITALARAHYDSLALGLLKFAPAGGRKLPRCRRIASLVVNICRRRSLAAMASFCLPATLPRSKSAAGSCRNHTKWADSTAIPTTRSSRT